ncbi:MAG: aminopeptidase P N-terminal domain-containing protein [Spirulinaceae cyanobacterium]
MAIAAAEYQQRRQRLLEKLGQGTAIFASAPLATMHNDVEYRFRQESDFYYLTGFNETNAIAVFAPHHEEHQFILFVQPKDPKQETWTGILTGVEAAKERYGADEVYPITELDEHLPQYLKKCDRLYYSFGRNERLDARMLRHWQRCVRAIAKNGYGPRALEDARFLLQPLRQVKSPAELALLRKAADLSVEAHLRAQELAKPGCYEYQVQAAIEHTFAMQGATPAYPSIVATGANACVLHYIDNQSQLQDGDLLLIDAGGAYQYYNADITRTFPVNGKFTKQQQALYELVLEAQLKAIEEVKAGKAYNEYHDMAVCVLVQGLLDLGLLQGDLEELIKEKKYKPFYMHRTGHWLGLDVHDSGAYKLTAEDWSTFQPGNLVTVEPGLYISPTIETAEDQPDVPEEWRGIGIRIEDDVLVTETGNEVLTAGVPK